MIKKIKNKLTKIALSCTAILSIFCTIKTPISAEETYTVSFGAPTGISYSASGPALGGVNTTDWNANYPTLNINGKVVFCLDPSQLIMGDTGGYTPSDFSVDLMRKMNLIALHGYYENGQSSNWYMASQFMMWELRGWSIDTTNLTNYASMKAEIQDKVNHHYDKPSFLNMPDSIKVGESVTLTDTNGVLNRFDVESNPGVAIRKSGNQLTITPSMDSPDELTIDLKAYDTGSPTASIAYKVAGSNSQEVALFSYHDVVLDSHSIKVLKFGSLKIAKQNDEGTMIPNTEFKLSYNADMSDLIGTYKTGADGTVKIDELLPQTVYLQEVSVPANLILNPTIHSITIIPNDTVSYNQTNAIQKGRITLKKTDSETGNKPQGEATLQGATYGLFARENIVDPITKQVLVAKNTKICERTTKADGSMDSIEDLYLGEYYVQELAPSTGYILNNEKINVSLPYGGATQSVVVKGVTSKETIINGDFQITKIYTEEPYESEVSKPEKGAVFQTVLKKYVIKYGSIENAWKHRKEFNAREYDELTSDSEGIALSKKLAYGTYVIKQVKAGHDDATLVKETFEAVIKDQNQPTIKYVVNNKMFTSYLQIVKKDSETGKIVTLSKASFKIYDVNHKEYLSQRVGLSRVDTWTTNEEGKVTLPRELSAGNYRLEEIKAPDGYLINKNGVDFKIKSSHISNVDEEGEPITVVEMMNEKPTGSVSLVKSDTDSKEVLSGVQYQLTAGEDVIDPADGSILYKAGAPVSKDLSEDGYYTTDEKGEIGVSELPLGTYSWKETKALDGYVKDTNIYTFTLAQKDDTTKIYTNHQALENQKTKVEILKEDKDGKALIGAKLHLSDSKDNVIKEWTSDKNVVRFEGLLVGEEYTLYEDEAPQGYVVSKPVSIKVKNTKDVQEFKMIDKQVIALKVDELDKPLKGAKLQVVSNKTKNIVDQWTSDEKAHAISNLMEEETYILQEIEAPNGYHKAKDMEFHVTSKKESQEIVMKDTLIMTRVQIEKTDAQTKKAIVDKEFMFTIYSDEKCTTKITSIRGDKKTGIAEASLPYGEYWIKESKAPLGYTLSKEVKHLIISKEGSTIDGKKLVDKDHILKFSFENTLLPKIKTGDQESNMLYLFLIMPTGFLIYLLLRRKREVQ